MKNILSLPLLLACHVGVVCAAPPAEELVQGLYQGRWQDSTGTAPAEVRCVALGDMKYRLLLRREIDGKIQRAEFQGSVQAPADAVTFTGTIGDQECRAEFSNGAIRGTIGAGGRLVVERTRRTSPTLGRKAPEGAVVLIDGKSFDNMQPGKGEWPAADERDGSIQVPKGGMRSVPSFSGGFDAHVEFMCPLEPKQRSQGRGNSGCYLPNGNEIQVLDSFGTGTYLGGGCAGLYKFRNPDTMDPIPSMEGHAEGAYNIASLPPLEWQTYDIEYRVKEDAEGKPKGFLTLHHNGIRVHNAVELPHKAGRFQFQDHSNPVRYRNIWVAETK